MPDDRELLIIGDRILIAPDNNKERTSTGLYLPQGIAEKEKVQTGYVVKTGPGHSIPAQNESGEPWTESRNEPHYVPLQVKEGDFAIFLRREAIEIDYDQKKYLIIPHAAVLAAVREKFTAPEL